MSQSFAAYVVSKNEQGDIETNIETLREDQLPEGDVLIRVEYSSLNYKDALAASGHPGVAKSLPHVPGIDCSGEVVRSNSDDFRPGEKVLVTGYSLGEGRWGGYAELVRMKSECVVPLPAGLTTREAMIYGTAGFTAAQSLLAIEEGHIDRSRGPVLVTGATGGVGSFAVALLSKSGYEVTAVTGKQSAHGYLRELGAAAIVGRDAVNDSSSRPMLSATWSSAVDTTGGNILGTILRSTQHRGVVAACGLVAGTEIPMNIYPFILRGVRLVGIDSAWCPMESRVSIWQQLASHWKLDNLEQLATSITIGQLDEYVAKILAGEVTGRILVEIGRQM